MASSTAPEQQVLLAKDVSFEKILHRGTAGTHQGLGAVLKKDREAQKAAIAEYFQHWDNKDAKDETEATRAVSWGLLFRVLVGSLITKSLAVGSHG